MGLWANNLASDKVSVLPCLCVHIILLICVMNDFRIRNASFVKIEPVHEISNNVVCATRKASDQPAHTRSLIRDFASRLNIL